MKRYAIVAIALSLFIAFPSAGLADITAIACGGKIVKVGDSKAKTLTTCGKPLKKAYVTEDDRPWWKIWGKTENLAVEKWVYDNASCGIRTLTFQGITLIKIEKGDEL
jgi:hypothetical protein